jgi:uncharacterized membrane protein
LRTALAVLALAAFLASAGPAAAKSFTLSAAHVRVTVEPDGALAVEEEISFIYDGSFSGGFREIPLRPGEQITDVFVAEGGTRYSPGAPTEIGSSGDPGTFGVARLEDGVRVVWHYRAFSELRTFTIGYTLRGLAVAYDDVVDVNLKVWGDEWEVPLGTLTAELILPAPASGRAYRAWGHPVSVRGEVQRVSDRVVLYANRIPSHQFVELRVVFPASLLSSPAAARRGTGNALDRIVAEELEDAAAFERDQERIRSALRNLPQTILVLLLAALGPAAAVLGATYWFFGRERGTGYDREYEQEPPSELTPALVPPLLRQRPAVGSHEFTATLFDLIRRGRYKAKPVTTERSVWAGLRKQDIADLELSVGDEALELADHERPVAKVIDDVLGGSTEVLSEFRTRIEEDRTGNSKRFTKFKEAVADEIKLRGWFSSDGLKLLLGSAALLGVAGALLLWIGIERFESFAPRWKDILFMTFGACACLNAGILGFAAVAEHTLWRRRSREAQQEAERWEAFRRYLGDFPRLDVAPPGSLALWERYLVYGIAFGIAERVLQGAHLHMPEELHQASSVFWISGDGDLGAGPTALGIGDLSSGFGDALAPPSSGSGGFGGGFSGSGGGGGGGGGGGAW